MRFCLQALVILALVMAGVSPACAFISGKSNLVEICTSQGIEYKPSPDAPTSDHHDKKQDDCSFCFNMAHGKSLKADAVAITLLSPALEQTAFNPVQTISLSTLYNPHAPRAPPTLL